MSTRDPVIHFRDPLGPILCGRRPAGGLASPGGSNHLRAATTCKACLRHLSGRR